MANEFIARNGLIAQNNSVVTGSLTVTQGITGSLLGTASLASTASFAPLYLPLAGGTLSGNLISPNNIKIRFFGPDTDDADIFRYFDSLVVTNGSDTTPTSKNIIIGGGPGNIHNDVYIGKGNFYVSSGSVNINGNTTITGSIYLKSGSVINSTGADIFIKAGVGNNAGVALYNNSSTQYLAVDDTGSYANKFTVADRLTVQGLTTTQNQIVSGSITLAGGSKITNEYDYPSIDIQAGIGGYVELLSNNQSSSVIITNQDVTVNTSGGSWIFGEDGTTSYPANVIAASFTGSLFGSASYALTASYALNAGGGGSGGTDLGLVQAMVVGLQNIF